jgi:hypothetical protein
MVILLNVVNRHRTGGPDQVKPQLIPLCFSKQRHDLAPVPARVTSLGARSTISPEGNALHRGGQCSTTMLF